MVSVCIIPPDSTFGLTRYKLLHHVSLAGITVLAGFVTDGASVPRMLWWLFPPVGRYFLAAVVHDYLLVTKKDWRYANKKFHEALKEQGVAPWVRITLFSAVQVYQFVKHEVLRRGY